MQIKFNNGRWKLFDPIRYRDVASFPLKSQAIDAATRGAK